jgi:hypothetical protein
MTRFINTSLVCSLLILSSVGFSQATPPIESFSAFKGIDTKALASGDILGKSMKYSGFSRGVATQTCYIIKAPLDKTADALTRFDASTHPELKVYKTKLFTSPDGADWGSFKFPEDVRSIKKFFEQTKDAVESDDGDIYLSKQDKSDLKAALKNKQDNVTIQNFWKSTLQERLQTFTNGGIKALPSYQIAGSSQNVEQEFRSLLSEFSEIKSRFDGALNEFVFTSTPPAPARHYWEIYESDRLGACHNGVIFKKELDGRIQIIDYQYYVSGSYLALITLYELNPVTVDGKNYTLVWRGDFISSKMFDTMKGIENMAANSLMLKSIKQSIKYSQQDSVK